MAKSNTITDVALDAGVSIKTVSRVINGEPHVSAKTRKKVLQSVQRLDFKVNAAARSLRAKIAKTLVLLLDNPSQSYSEAVRINAVLACQPFGFQLAIVQKPDFADFRQKLHDGELVGVVLTPPLSNDLSLLSALGEASIPFVRVGAERNSRAGDKIGIDDRKAACEMTRYLLELGHRRIGFIAGDSAYDVSRRRLNGHLDALGVSEIARDDSLIVEGDFSYASGLACAEILLKLEVRPTAIFASNDDMAAGCLASAYKHGVRVPDALTVVGFDDAPFSRIIYPALTTVYQSIQQMMEEAVAVLAARRSDPLAPLRDAVISHSIVIRESSAAPP